LLDESSTFYEHARPFTQLSDSYRAPSNESTCRSNVAIKISFEFEVYARARTHKGIFCDRAAIGLFVGYIWIRAWMYLGGVRPRNRFAAKADANVQLATPLARLKALYPLRAK